jgi:hypothetical protein
MEVLLSQNYNADIICREEIERQCASHRLGRLRRHGRKVRVVQLEQASLRLVEPYCSDTFLRDRCSGSFLQCIVSDWQPPHYPCPNRANIRTACPEPSTQRFAWALAGSLIAIEKTAWTWVIKGVH